MAEEQQEQQREQGQETTERSLTSNVREEFFIERQGKRMVLFAGLLDAAHGEGLSEVDTELLQVPDGANNLTAIVKAKVVTERGTFSGIGDASPDNVNRNIAPHIIRQAETRAKARALRDAVNVGATALEEFEVDSSQEDSGSGGQYRQGQRGSGQRGSGGGQGRGQQGGGQQGGGGGGTTTMMATESQQNYLRNLADKNGGIEDLEKSAGKSLEDFTRSDAQEWIDRLKPKSSQS